MKKISIVTMLGVVLSCSSAHAHAHLVNAAPADGAVLQSSPTNLSLSFTETIEPKLSGATVTRQDGTPVAAGAASPSMADGKILNIPLPVRLSEGSYSVEWHAFSSDGHPTRGNYRFEVEH